MPKISDSAGGGRLHAVQLWIALPDESATARRLSELSAAAAARRLGGFSVRVLAGSAFGKTSPAEVYSPVLAGSGCRRPCQHQRALSASFEHARPGAERSGQASQIKS